MSETHEPTQGQAAEEQQRATREETHTLYLISGLLAPDHKKSAQLPLYARDKSHAATLAAHWIAEHPALRFIYITPYPHGLGCKPPLPGKKRVLVEERELAE